ncbi:MAG: hypothetical protein ACI8ZB_005459 [Desulforhopalus sp.]|jgi:hypothetical protein
MCVLLCSRSQKYNRHRPPSARQSVRRTELLVDNYIKQDVWVIGHQLNREEIRRTERYFFKSV